MKNLFVAALALGLALSATSAQAKQNHKELPVYACDLKGAMSGERTFLFERLQGTGTLSCVSPTGYVTQLPVNLALDGVGPGVVVAHINSVRVVGLGIGIVNPAKGETIDLGVQAVANIPGVGLTGTLAFEFEHHGLGAKLSFTGEHLSACSFGAGVYATKFTITPAYVAPPPPTQVVPPAP